MLQVKYKERLAQTPLLRAAKEEQLMTQAYEGQIAGKSWSIKHCFCK